MALAVCLMCLDKHCLFHAGIVVIEPTTLCLVDAKGKEMPTIFLSRASSELYVKRVGLNSIMNLNS